MSSDGENGIANLTLSRARELMSEGQFEEAAEALRPLASERSVADPEVLLAYGRALMGSDRISLAVWPLQRVAERPDASPAARRLYARALLNGGADREAIREATRMLEEDPNDPEARAIRAYGYRAVLDEEAALSDFEILVDIDPENARYVEQLITIQTKLARWDEARESIGELREILARKEVSAEIAAGFCATAARFEAERGELERAEVELRKCRELHPAQPDVIFSLEELLDQTDRSDEAMALMRESAKQAPGRFRLQEGLANRLIRLGHEEEGEAVLIAAAERIGRPDPWLALADLRFRGRDYSGAVEAIDHAIRVGAKKDPADPDFDYGSLSAEGRFAFGEVFVVAGETERAEAVIASLEEEEPAFALLLRARLRLDSGDPAAALEDYEEAFRLFPSNPAARYLAGRAALEIGKIDLAAAYYQDALRAAPEATDAGLVLARMQHAEGRPGAAADTLSTYLVGHPDDAYGIRLFAQCAAEIGLREGAEAARAQLASQIDWAGVALADQARDLGRLEGLDAARRYLESSPDFEKPSHYEAFSTWVGILQTQGKQETARKRALEVRKRNEESAGPWIVWARIQLEEENLQEALVAIERAIERGPLMANAHFDHGQILLELERVDEAVEAFDRAAELAPQEARGRYAAAVALREAQREAEAADRFSTLLIDHPWHGAAALDLVELELARGEEISDRVFHLGQRAARFNRIAGPGVWLSLGRMQLERELYEGAARSFQRSILLEHEVPTARFLLAQVWIHDDRLEEARSELERVLASDDFSGAAEARALLDSSQGSGHGSEAR